MPETHRDTPDPLAGTQADPLTTEPQIRRAFPARFHGINGMVSALEAWQPSLFGSDNPKIDPTFADIERIDLDPDSWVDYCPAWLSGSTAAFEELAGGVHWSQRTRWMYTRQVTEPRLTSWRRVGPEEYLRPVWLDQARDALRIRYEVDFDSVGMNFYRGGDDSVAWHRDRIPKEVEDPIVALLSVGAPRRFLLRPRGGGASRSFMLGEGDLLVTGGQTQRRFEHSVPKVKSAGARISLAFRHGAR